MSDQNTAPTDDATSHARLVAWVLSILAAPVLYLLSAPPLVIGVMDSLPPAARGTPPLWLKLYVMPAEWLHKNTPLKQPLRAYGQWCSEKMRPTPAP